MSVSVNGNVPEVTISRRKVSPGPRPEGISAQSTGTSVCAPAPAGANRQRPASRKTAASRRRRARPRSRAPGSGRAGKVKTAIGRGTCRRGLVAEAIIGMLPDWVTVPRFPCASGFKSCISGRVMNAHSPLGRGFVAQSGRTCKRFVRAFAANLRGRLHGKVGMRAMQVGSEHFRIMWACHPGLSPSPQPSPTRENDNDFETVNRQSPRTFRDVSTTAARRAGRGRAPYRCPRAGGCPPR